MIHDAVAVTAVEDATVAIAEYKVFFCRLATHFLLWVGGWLKGGLERGGIFSPFLDEFK